MRHVPLLAALLLGIAASSFTPAPTASAINWCSFYLTKAARDTCNYKREQRRQARDVARNAQGPRPVNAVPDGRGGVLPLGVDPAVTSAVRHDTDPRLHQDPAQLMADQKKRVKFIIPALYHPSVQLCAAATKHVHQAQAWYAKAAVTIDHYHRHAKAEFYHNYGHAVNFYHYCREAHQKDDDPLRRLYVATRLVVLRGWMVLLNEQYSNMPKPNPALKAVVVTADTIVDVTIAAAFAVVKGVEVAAKVAVEVVKYAVLIPVFLVYKGIELAVEAVKVVAGAVKKAAVAAKDALVKFWETWGFVHRVRNNEDRQLLFRLLDKRCTDHFHGDWHAMMHYDVSNVVQHQSHDLGASLHPDYRKFIEKVAAQGGGKHAKIRERARRQLSEASDSSAWQRAEAGFKAAYSRAAQGAQAIFAKMGMQQRPADDLQAPPPNFGDGH